jgi:hypothetical protein
MRSRILAIGPVLAGCALVALTSCSTDENGPEAGLAPSMSPAITAVSAYDIVKVPSMTIDGNLSDWANVSAISIADNSGRTGGVDNTAKVKLAWNDTYLFASYDVTDTELLALQTAHDNPDIYKDDEVELYIDPQGDGAGVSSMTATDYQFLANVRDALGENRGNGVGGKDAGYNPASFLARAATNGTLNASGTDVGYTIELRIAWGDLGINNPAAGNFMRIDPAVGDRDAGTPPVQDFDWAGLALFNNPSGWKDVKLVIDASAPATPTNLALSVISSSQIDVSWTASTSSDVAKYKIYRATSGTPTLLTSVNGSPYHDTGLTASTAYTYQVSAVDAAGNESAKTPPASATTTGSGSGIPFGLWTIRPDSILPPTIWTGGARTNKRMTDILAQLDSNPSHLRMWWNMTSGDEKVFRVSDSNHAFSVKKWKDTLDAHVGTATPSSYYARLLPYIQDGTLQGHVLLDDLMSFDPTPTAAQIDSIAAYSKLRFPGLLTAARARPTQLKTFSGGAPYTQLDVGWAQYRWDQGDRAVYRDAEIAAAKLLKLGIVLGINITNGPGESMVAIDSVLNWGTKLLEPVKSDYACGFIMWNITYDNVRHQNMTTLSNIAKNHVAAPCKRR